MAPSLLAKFHFILTIDKYLRNFFILLQSSLTDIFKKAMSQYYINHKKKDYATHNKCNSEVAEKFIRCYL